MKTTKNRSIKTLLTLQVTELNQEEITKVMQHKIKEHSKVFDQACKGEISTEEHIKFLANMNVIMTELNDWYEALENSKDKSLDELLAHFD